MFTQGTRSFPTVATVLTVSLVLLSSTPMTFAQQVPPKERKHHPVEIPTSPAESTTTGLAVLDRVSGTIGVDFNRLSWSGATLYDLCMERLRVCRPANDPAIQLTDLFEQDVTRDMLIDALDHMQQPRDSFKFLYAVIQEHCRIVSEDQATYRIARLTLDTVRRQQAQRVQELHRGLAPA